MDLCHILLNKSNGATFHRLKVEDNTCHFLSLEKNLLLGLYTSPLNLPKRRNQELQVLDDKSRQKRSSYLDDTCHSLAIYFHFMCYFWISIFAPKQKNDNHTVPELDFHHSSKTYGKNQAREL